MGDLEDDNVVELGRIVSAAALRRSLKGDGRLQCRSPLSSSACSVVDAFLAKHPATCLRVYQAVNARTPPELAFLANLPSLRDAWICANPGNLNDLAPLAALPSALRSLLLDTLEPGLGKTGDKAKANAGVLSRFSALVDLCLCGQFKDLEFLAAMPKLRTLRLWRTKLKTLAGIERASGLRLVELKSCGAKDLAPLAALPALRELEVWDQRNLENLQTLAQLPGLERLSLVSCGRGAALPDFSGFKSLRVLVLHSMVDRSQLAAIAAAPSLRCIVLSNSPDLDSVEALRPLAGHPTLQELRIDGERRHAAIADAYRWKVTHPNFPASEYLSGK